MRDFGRDIRRLERILEVKAELDDCVAGKQVTRDDIIGDRDTRWMVSMPLLDITEQVSALSQGFLNAYPIPDFKSIKGMRNRLVHGYGDVNQGYIADAVFDDLPELAQRCREIIDDYRDHQAEESDDAASVI